ncbi:hypothetical protein C8F01DRAFT_1105942 [Mycena amicta]|nr:hypothetical protein C8F01DRAFT_1105942 [Mycena amicta]
MPRRNYLDIAPEIWLNCWLLCTVPELQRLCLTCRFFAVICQPLRFRRMYRHPPTVHALLDTEDGPGMSWAELVEDVERRTMLLQEFAASTYASTAVRSWHFSRINMVEARNQGEVEAFTDLFSAWYEFGRVFTTSLGAYSRLSKLSLFGLDFDGTLWEALETLESLEDLKFATPYLEESQRQPLRLKRLQIVLWWPGYSEEQWIGDQLRVSSSETLTEFSATVSSYVLPLIATFVLDHVLLPQMTSLNLDIAYDLLLWVPNLLALCPALEYLSFSYGGPVPAPEPLDYPETLLSLPPSVIPNLRSFSGPLPLAQAIVPGRPLKDVSISNAPAHEEWAEVHTALDEISKSSSPIHSLSLYHAFPPQETKAILSAITRYFPELYSLHIRLYQRLQQEFVAEFTDSEDEACVSAEGSRTGYVRRRTRRTQYQCVDWEGFPPLEISGHLYESNSSSEAKPPPTISPNQLSPQEIGLHHLLFTKLDFPPNLQILQITHDPRPPYPLLAQHAILLRMEKVLPRLRELELTGQTRSWVRDRHLWTTRDVSESEETLPTRFSIVSQVWRADGTRYDVES